MLENIIHFFSPVGSFALKRLLPGVVIAAIGILLIQIVIKIVRGILDRSKLEKAAHSLIISAIRVVGYVLLCLIVASSLGIDVTSIVALASVLTLAVSLALQNILANVIGGFTLLYTKPFASGDFVEIAGQSGTVQEIGLTYTQLATGDNKIVSIPNSAVVAAQIVNYTTTGTRRVDINISASYDAPVEEVLAALRQAGTVDTSLESPAPFAAISNYGESTIEYLLQVWCKSEDYWTTTFEARKNIKATFDALGVKMSYPHINVHMEK